MAIDVLVKNPLKAGIETVVRVAAEGTDRIAREYARNSLHQHVQKIVSPTAAEYVLLQGEQQVAQFGQPSDFLLEILGKCLSGLSVDNKGLPPDVARRALAILWQSLSRVRPTDNGFIPLLAALAFPEFGPAAGQLEHWLATTADEMIQVRILDTLIAMDAPNLLDLVVRLASSDRSRALQARASEYVSENANIDALAQFPNPLKHVAYRVAIQKGIRFLRAGFRHKVILANGATYGPTAQ